MGVPVTLTPMLRHALPLALCLSTAAPAVADVKCAAIFGDHMVLQRNSEVAVWGWADPGEHVTVQGSWSDLAPVTVTGSDGGWSVRVATPEAGGPHTLKVQGSNDLTFQDVMVGEVWVCSGQSNMEWSVRASANPDEEIASANHPNLRIFDVARAISTAPVEDVRGSWAAVTPETIASFSAVGYSFGRELQANFGTDIPVGLIGSNWGGTVAESWTSREGLADYEEFAPLIDRIDEHLAGTAEDPLTVKQERWWANLLATDAGGKADWMQPRVDTAGWQDVSLPGLFKDFGKGDFDGVMWYRRAVTVPADWAGKDLVLELGPVDDMDLTYLNGALVGATKVPGNHARPRQYTIPADKVHAGRANVLAVAAVDTGGAGAVGLDTNMLLRPKEGEGSLDLSGTWRARAGSPIGTFDTYPGGGSWFHANYVTALHNGMIAPIVPYGIRGAIWYQGESNRGRAAQYRRVFPGMITDWRNKWGIGDFSFYFVQLAPFHYGGDTGQLAELREAQLMTLDLPNTGMAVTMDIGNVRDIHPRNKQDVGKRLARWALAKDYGYDLVYSGPLYRSMVVVGDAARLHFEHGAGLRSDGPPTNFTMAGPDGVFHPATAVIDGEMIVVRSEQVAQPRSVRYCWGTTDEGNLFNGAGLPASSFRTDAWPPASSWQ